MDSYEINETLIGGSNLKVKEETYKGKTFYIVTVKPNNSKKPIMYKYYNGDKGAFDPDMQSTFDLDVPFATKAKAEAFITDLRNDIK